MHRHFVKRPFLTEQKLLWFQYWQHLAAPGSMVLKATSNQRTTYSMNGVWRLVGACASLSLWLRSRLRQGHHRQHPWLQDHDTGLEAHMNTFWPGPAGLLFADAMVYGMASVANGIAEGWASKAAMPNTGFSIVAWTNLAPENWKSHV